MSAGLIRTVIETFAGYLLLLLILHAANPSPESYRGPVLTLIALFSWLWLAWWPAWRLTLPQGTFWLRLTVGVIRSIGIGMVLAVVGALLATVLYRPSGNFLQGGTAVAVAILFFMGRCTMVFLAMLKRWVERRLRWQLMASHIAAVVLTFVTISFFGSIAVTAVVINAVRPQPALMAQSVATTLKANGVAGRPTSARAADVSAGWRAARFPSPARRRSTSC